MVDGGRLWMIISRKEAFLEVYGSLVLMKRGSFFRRLELDFLLVMIGAPSLRCCSRIRNVLKITFRCFTGGLACG